MTISTHQRRRLRSFFSSADTAHMTLHDAGRHVRQLAPLYHPHDVRDRITAADGTRWYADPLDALVDEIWRATHRPHDTEVLLVRALGQPQIDATGFVGMQPVRRAAGAARS